MIEQHYLDDCGVQLRKLKTQAEKAIAQVDDRHLFAVLDPESNSIAIIMKHMAGNMFSRWTDFLTTDGEKPNRNRDMEFVMDPNTTAKDVRDYWERGWQCVFAALEPLSADDLMTKVMIRGEEHTVAQAINRQLMHYADHIGQIIFLAKHFHARDWKTLSIPRNRSAQFNAYLQDQAAAPDSEERVDES